MASIESRPAILVPVHWLTDYGGLHENVLDTVTALLQVGYRCVVLAPKAKFNERFRAIGAELIEHDYCDLDETIRLGIAAGPFDLVHSHPFQAHIVGTAVAKAVRARLTLTIHGQYMDDIDDRVEAIICVSERISEYLQFTGGIKRERLHVIPNGVDTQVFQPEMAGVERQYKQQTKIITVCSRIDPDKKVLFQCVADLVEHLADCGSNAQVVLQGENFYGDVDEFRRSIQERSANSAVEIRNSPWCTSRIDLAKVFHQSDLVVASGRAAAESLCCLRPTIAVASRGYVGLLDPRSISVALATNFGGCREPATEYSRARLISDLQRAERISHDELHSARHSMLQQNSLSLVADSQSAMVKHLLQRNRGEML